MNPACQEFRARLAQALGASAQRVFAPEFEWHTHVLTCGECRALLEAEQALEQVLAHLPEPKLPPELAQRVIARLHDERSESALDRVLDRALCDPWERADESPERIAADLLQRLASARAEAAQARRSDAALDRLLDRAGAVQTPVGLSARVLKRLQAARRGVQASEVRALRALRATSERDTPRTATRSWAWLAAAGVAVLAGAAAWLLSRPSQREPRREDYVIEVPPTPQLRDEGDTTQPRSTPESAPATPQVAQTEPQRSFQAAPEGAASELEPDVELLAQLELLESWELLADEALELELLGVDENTLLSLQSLEFEAAEAADSDVTPSPSAPVDSDRTPKNG